MSRVNMRTGLALALLVALGLIPFLAAASATPFLVTLFTRIVVLAIAAVSLNLILGYGGMISLGHAVYLGVGAYVIGIMAHHGIYSGFIQWPLALAVSGLFALVIGTLCLRTKGVYFLMITLAFAQMVYFLAGGLEEYGGDDGLTIYQRSSFGDLINLNDKATFYYICWVSLMLCVLVMWRLTNSRFGLAVQGARSNDRRMQALGIPTNRYRLAAFVISGVMCGLAGILLANHTDFVNPDLMHWTRSGDLIIMVLLGGLGTLVGPVAGTVAFLVLEDVLSGITEYWQIILGPLLLLMALYKRGGIAGLLPGGRRD